MAVVQPRPGWPGLDLAVGHQALESLRLLGVAAQEVVEEDGVLDVEAVGWLTLGFVQRRGNDPHALAQAFLLRSQPGEVEVREVQNADSDVTVHATPPDRPPRRTCAVTL